MVEDVAAPVERRLARTDARLARLVPALVLLLMVTTGITGIFLWSEHNGRLAAERQSRDDRMTASAERRELIAGVASLTAEVHQARADVAQLAADNEVLREQLLKRGIKPAVPVRVVNSPSTSTPTTAPPAGSSTSTTTTPTTAPGCRACVGSTCVTTPGPVCP